MKLEFTKYNKRTYIYGIGDGSKIYIDPATIRDCPYTGSCRLPCNKKLVDQSEKNRGYCVGRAGLMEE